MQISGDVNISCGNNAPYGTNCSVLHRDNGIRM